MRPVVGSTVCSVHEARTQSEFHARFCFQKGLLHLEIFTGILYLRAGPHSNVLGTRVFERVHQSAEEHIPYQNIPQTHKDVRRVRQVLAHDDSFSTRNQKQNMCIDAEPENSRQ